MLKYIPSQSNPKVWLTYNTSAKIARNLKNGNQFYIGLLANFSTLEVSKGTFDFYLKEGVQSGTYTDKGSYVGLNLGYSFARKTNQAIIAPVRGIEKSDSRTFKKVVYAEFLGAGLGFTGNFDMRFKLGQTNGFGLRAGAGFIASYLNLPVGLNYIGNGKNALEAGMGYTQLINIDSQNGDEKYNAAGTATVGLRFQPVEKGFLYRLNWNPFYIDKRVGLLAFGGSIGYSFK